MPNLFKSLFRRSDVADPNAPLPGVIPPQRTASSDDPLSLGAVFRAIQVLTTAASQLSIDAIKAGLPLPAQPSILRKPDVALTRSQWIMEAVASLALDGNAFLRVARDPNDQISNLEVLAPQKVAISKTDGQPLRYLYQGGTYSKSEILHIKFLAIPGQARGLGPVESARRELSGALDLRNYAAEIFQTGDVPSGVLTSDQVLSPEQATEAKARWADTADGGVRVLGKNLTYNPLVLKADDAQYIQTRKLTRTEIAQLFGVPAGLMLVDAGSSLTYSNIEQEWLGFVRFTLMAYLKPIEDVLSETLPHGTTARFNLEALLRADTTTRYGNHALAIGAGFQTVNEAREIEGRPPLVGKHAAPDTPPATEEVTA